MSLMPPFWYPSLSAGLSLQKRLIRSFAPFPVGNRLLGNDAASIPFRIILYVFRGSLPVNGGVPEVDNLQFKLWCNPYV